MEKIEKALKIAVLAAVIVFCATACALLADEDNDGPVNYKSSFKIDNEQVWEGTDSNKLSEVYKKFEGERGISVNIYYQDEDGNFPLTKKIGPGIIEKGRLTCEVSEPQAGDLMEWDNFKAIFSEWNYLDCVPKVKGTFLEFVTSENEWLSREKMSGSSDSLWLESILFVYVDKDCKITGTPIEGIRPGEAFYKTTEPLDLQLLKGWNTICQKQLLEGMNGIEADSLIIKNPNDFKWAIRSEHP